MAVKKSVGKLKLNWKSYLKMEIKDHMKIGRKDHKNNSNWGLDPEKKRFVRLRDELTVNNIKVKKNKRRIGKRIGER